VNIGHADIERIVKAVVQSMDPLRRCCTFAVKHNCAAQTPAIAHAPDLPMGVFASLDDAVAEADKAYRQMRSVAMRSLGGRCHSPGR
jgi:hypothetical protein